MDIQVFHDFNAYVAVLNQAGQCPAETMVSSCAAGDGTRTLCRRDANCPTGYETVFDPNQQEGYCRRVKPEPPKCCTANGGFGGGFGGGGGGGEMSTKSGNPIQTAGGQKLQTEVDVAATGNSRLEFKRYYSSSGFYTPAGTPRSRESLGAVWRHTYQRDIVLQTAQSSAQTSLAYVVRPDGDYNLFRWTGSVWKGPTDSSETLQEVLDGQGTRTGWRYTAANDDVELYDAAGRLQSITSRDAVVVTLAYSDANTPASVAPHPGLPVLATDSFGRTLSWRYDTYGRLIETTDSAGNVFGYRYDDAARLGYVDRPDGSHRQYLYNELAHFTTPLYGYELLTGIIDENNVRYATYEYDGFARVSKEWHGSTNADLLTVGYNGQFLDDASWAEITDAFGVKRKKKFAIVNGVLKVKTFEQPSCAGSGCTPVTLTGTATFDTNGNRDLVTDLKGTITDYDFNASGQEVSRKEGVFATPAMCPQGSSYDSGNYGSSCTSGTCWGHSQFAGSSSGAPLGWPGWYYSCRATALSNPLRTTQTIWNSTFRVPDQRSVINATGGTESLTKWAYNSRGQVLSRCAIDPSVSYVCGSAANAPAGVRQTTYTYCEQAGVTAGTCPLIGLVLSVDGPRTDVSDVATYTYYASTDESGCATVGGVCHRKGDLWKATNALGQVTETVSLDKTGRVTRSKDANGTLTDFTYHARGWLLTRTVRANANGTPDATNDATTTFTYDNVGQVTRVTQPDGAYLNYTYDDAHRLTDITDNLGNRIHYTLDAMGNRTKEETFDANYNPGVPGQGLKRSLSRAYNQLNRLIQSKNAQLQVTSDYSPFDTTSPRVDDGYDVNGNIVHTKDGLNVETVQEYDPLNRLTKTIQDYLGTDASTKDATTQYEYDARDNLRKVIDPSALSTTYDYDTLNNLTGLHSPDTGNTAYTYDAAGNRLTQTDARNITSNYTYDALNRLVGIAYPTSSLNVGFAYDQADNITGCSGSSPQGRLTKITDSSGSTVYCYDRRGNVTSKTQVAGAGGTSITLVTGYTYSKADRLMALTYPSGAIVDYTRNAIGQITDVKYRANAGAAQVTVLSAASYLPFGPLTQLTFGNGRVLTKSYDANYQIDAVSDLDTGGLVLDFTPDVMGNITAASSTLGGAATRNYKYDRLYRLNEVDTGANALVEGFGYNKTGDRTSKTLPGQSAQVYSYLAGTHRLGSVAGVARQYDANGNTVDRGASPTMGYDDRNRLATAATGFNGTKYNYNGRGERVTKLRSTGSGANCAVLDVFGYDHRGQLLSEYSSGQPDQATCATAPSVATPALTADYVYLDSMPVATVRAGVIYYLETDHLGTPRVAVDSDNNTMAWGWDFFGSAFGEQAQTGSLPMNLRYPGQYADVETGLNYNYFRDYEAGAGRYIESDPIGLRGGLNTYTYAKQDPLKYVDRLGLWGSLYQPPNEDPPPPNPLGRVVCEAVCVIARSVRLAEFYSWLQTGLITPLEFTNLVADDAPVFRQCMLNCIQMCP